MPSLEDLTPGARVRGVLPENMTERVPELEELPRGLVLDGELVALNEAGAPHWPLLCDRVLHGDTSIRVTYFVFDVLRVDGHDLTRSTWEKRRTVLEEIVERGSCTRISDVFDDGETLFDAVCEHGLEGIVAKRRNGVYRPGYRGWTKIKNTAYWRRASEVAGMQRRRERLAVV